MRWLQLRFDARSTARVNKVTIRYNRSHADLLTYLGRSAATRTQVGLYVLEYMS